MRIKGYTKSGVLIFVPVLFSIAVLPLFNLDFTAMSQGRLAEANVNADNLYLFVVNSATFGTLATFSFLHFRRRRPLSSIAPLLYFCFWCFVFAPIYIFVYSQLQSEDIILLACLFALIAILFHENQRAAKTVFLNEW